VARNHSLEQITVAFQMARDARASAIALRPASRIALMYSGLRRITVWITMMLRLAAVSGARVSSLYRRQCRRVSRITHDSEGSCACAGYPTRGHCGPRDARGLFGRWDAAGMRQTAGVCRRGRERTRGARSLSCNKFKFPCTVRAWGMRGVACRPAMVQPWSPQNGARRFWAC